MSARVSTEGKVTGKKATAAGVQVLISEEQAVHRACSSAVSDSIAAASPAGFNLRLKGVEGKPQTQAKKTDVCKGKRRASWADCHQCFWLMVTGHSSLYGKGDTQGTWASLWGCAGSSGDVKSWRDRGREEKPGISCSAPASHSIPQPVLLQGDTAEPALFQLPGAPIFRRSTP